MPPSVRPFQVKNPSSTGLVMGCQAVPGMGVHCFVRGYIMLAAEKTDALLKAGRQ